MPVLADPDTLDRLILWRMDDPRFIDRATRRKGIHMQRQWTIEARADFADAEKNEAITEAVRKAAAHINATLVLLSDGQKPQVVAYSDDFFAGHEDINVLGDPLGRALEAHGDQIEDGVVSDELLHAAQDIGRETKADE